MEYEIYKEGELYHWGIKGMRWGVRRYQNKDGSLTAAGKKKLRAEQAKVRQEEQTLKNKQSVKARFDRLEARKKAVEEGNKELDGDNSKVGRKSKKGSSTDTAEATKKSIKDMSDDELLRAVNRSRLEEQYRQLNPEPPVKQSLMSKLKNEVVVPAATNSGKKFLENALNKVGESILKDKADPNSLEALKKTYEKLDLQKKIEKLKNGAGDDLSIEDQNKKTRLQWDAEDRAAKSRGYNNAADEANQKRQAAANEAARKANEAKSQEYYNSSYNTTKVKYGTEYVNAGKTQTSNAVKSLPSSTSNLPAKTVDSGKSRVSGLLDGPKNEPKFILEDKDGKRIAYWSGIRGDSDVII